jgi:hypothetical protein
LDRYADDFGLGTGIGGQKGVEELHDIEGVVLGDEMNP